MFDQGRVEYAACWGSLGQRLLCDRNHGLVPSAVRLHVVGLGWPVGPGCIGLASLVLVHLSLRLGMGALGAHLWG